MIATIGVMDIFMAVTIIGLIGFIVAGIIWAVLRHDNKIGPLASAEQAYKIEQHRVEAVLAAKNAEAKMAFADANIIEAQAKVAEAHARFSEAELARLDRQLGIGKGEEAA